MNTPQSKTRALATASTFQMMARLAAVALLSALLASSAFALPYIYVANAGEDTVSKIDIVSNTEVARYATWFTGPPNNFVHPVGFLTLGPAPSRLLQDSTGNLFVLNRFFQPSHSPVLLKIAPSGGTPATTSTGPVALPLLDTGTTNNQIDAADTKDARIVWGQPVGPPGAIGRALCIDTSGILWVGMYSEQKYYKVDPVTGNTIGAPISVGPPLFGGAGHRPYGCQVDAKGELWSVDANNQLLEINTFTNQVIPHPYAGTNYSLSLFNGCGTAPSKVYLSERSATYTAYDPLAPPATAFSAAPLPATELFPSLAVGVDLNGDVVSGRYTGKYVAGNLVESGRVIKTSPTGAVKWDTNTLPAGPAVPSGDQHGIIIDERNDVWAVHLNEDEVVKYSGGDGHWLATVKVGRAPYTYGNAPPPTCPCAQINEPQIKCDGKNKDGKWQYSWSFTFTNHSPFTTPATTIDISGSSVTDLTPTQVTFQNPVPVNGQATVSGTFTLANPVQGNQICLDIRLNAGEGWCCPLEHVCFTLPECPTCAKLEGAFKCGHGRWFLQLSVTNLGPTAATGVQVFSNTPGVTVGPQMTMQNFPQNTAVIIPLTVTGATPGQVINLNVNVHGPIDDRTGVFSWCCMSTVQVTYPKKNCPWNPGGWIFEDLNANGLRNSGEGGLSEWTVTLTDGKGMPHNTTTDASGAYHFDEIEPGKYRLSVQPPQGWRLTVPKGAYSVTPESTQNGTFDFGFVKTRQ
jgi:hypothetical protein